MWCKENLCSFKSVSAKYISPVHSDVVCLQYKFLPNKTVSYQIFLSCVTWKSKAYILCVMHTPESIMGNGCHKQSFWNKQTEMATKETKKKLCQEKHHKSTGLQLSRYKEWCSPSCQWKPRSLNSGNKNFWRWTYSSLFLQSQNARWHEVILARLTSSGTCGFWCGREMSQVNTMPCRLVLWLLALSPSECSFTASPFIEQPWVDF